MGDVRGKNASASLEGFIGAFECLAGCVEPEDWRANDSVCRAAREQVGQISVAWAGAILFDRRDPGCDLIEYGR